MAGNGKTDRNDRCGTCGSPCDWEGLGDCEGDVAVIDEDEDWCPVHACERHKDFWFVGRTPNTKVA